MTFDFTTCRRFFYSAFVGYVCICCPRRAARSENHVRHVGNAMCPQHFRFGGLLLHIRTRSEDSQLIIVVTTNRFAGFHGFRSTRRRSSRLARVE